MFVHFRFLRARGRRRKDHESDDLTLESANLTPGQIGGTRLGYGSSHFGPLGPAVTVAVRCRVLSFVVGFTCAATAQKALKILDLNTRLEELTKQDFVVFLYAMGLNPTDDIIDSKLRTFKLHHKKTFTFGQLAHVWHSMLQDLTDEDEILKRAFQFFDKDGNGEISVQELRTTMHELGDLLTEEEITAFMDIMDVNNDGAIGYNEFLATLKTQAPNMTASVGEKVSVDLGEGHHRRQSMAPQHSTALGQSMGPREPSSAAAAAVARSSGAGPNGTWPQPLNVPSGATSDQVPNGDGRQSTASPFAAAAGADAGGARARADTPGANCGSNGAGAFDGGPREQTLGTAERSPVPLVRGGSASSSQLPAFPARRQTSLKAGLPTPLPAVVAEPLLEADAPSALSQPSCSSSNRRLGPSLSMPRAASGSGAGPQPPMERPGSLRRTDGRPLSGSGAPSGLSSGINGQGDPGQGLRAPSALDWGSGTDGT